MASLRSDRQGWRFGCAQSRTPRARAQIGEHRGDIPLHHVDVDGEGGIVVDASGETPWNRQWAVRRHRGAGLWRRRFAWRSGGRRWDGRSGPCDRRRRWIFQCLGPAGVLPLRLHCLQGLAALFSPERPRATALARNRSTLVSESSRCIDRLRLSVAAALYASMRPAKSSSITVAQRQASISSRMAARARSTLPAAAARWNGSMTLRMVS